MVGIMMTEISSLNKCLCGMHGHMCNMIHMNTCNFVLYRSECVQK